MTYRAATPADKEAALRLLERSFGVPQDPFLWDWLFTRNPSRSEMHYRVADAGGPLAGQYATMPVRLQHAGRPLLGLLSLHTATDPDFERRGIFTSLAQELYAEAAPRAPIVYGFPNERSAPGFYRKLGWVELRPFPVLVRPVGHVRTPLAARQSPLAPLGYVTDALALLGLVVPWAIRRRGELKGARVAALDKFGAWADDLWDSLRPQLGTCAIRDASFLTWRFTESPFSYKLYALDRGSGPTGFAVLSCRPWRGGTVADLMELMAPQEDPWGAALLLATAILDASSSGAIAVRAIVSSRHPHRSAFLKAGFLPIPQRMKQGYSFGVAVLDASQVVPNELLHLEDWYISGADLDYI